jgi:hypothetical protein
VHQFICFSKLPVRAFNASVFVKSGVFIFLEIRDKLLSTNFTYLSGAYQSSKGSAAFSEGNSFGYFPVVISSTGIPSKSVGINLLSKIKGRYIKKIQ